MKLAAVARRTAAVLAATTCATVPLAALPAADAVSITVLVNEVSKDGSYVELRNVRMQPIDVSGWSVWACKAHQSQVLKLVTIPAGHTVPANGSYLVAGPSYTGAPSPDLLWWGTQRQQGLPSVRITDASGAIVDQVGAEEGNPCVEGTKASAILAGNQPASFALGRSSTTDRDNNALDFGDVDRDPAASGQRATPAVPPTPIHELDGTNGGKHTIQGVVTGIDDRTGSSYDRVYPEQRGVFLQEEQGDQDGKPATSEGIFVTNVDEPSEYRPGDVVRVTGNVLPGGTWPVAHRQIQPKSAPGGTMEKTGTAPVPEPVTIDPARAAAEGPAYYKTLDGMRVRLAEGTANSGGTNKFGEVFVNPGAERKRLFRTDPRQDVIGVVDDAGAGNPANSYKDRASSTRLEVDLFDRLEDVVGPMAHSFDNWKIFPQPGALPRVRPYGAKQYPVRLAPPPAGQVRIVSFNLENFFPPGVPVGGAGTESTPQGVPTEEEYADQRAEILAALDGVLGRPDVIAVQEVYANAAGSTALDDLAARLSRGSETYTAYVAKSNDSRGIANGYLVKSTMSAANPRLLGAAEPGCGGKLYDRPPFAVDVVLGEHVVTLLNNHFKSKGGADQGVPCRDAQATYLAARVAEIEQAGGEAIVLGDLNSYETEDAVATRVKTGNTLRNLWDVAPEEERYSYAYQGRLQTLDHMLVTDDVWASELDFSYSHIDTDYADRMAAGGARVVDGHGLSDHNPPVLTISASLAAAEPDVVVPEAPWSALLLLGGLGAAAGALARAARRPVAA